MEKDVNEPIRSMLDRAYDQALEDFAKWVNENQMKEFNIDIWISNSDKPSCDMNDLVKLFLKNIRSSKQSEELKKD